MRVLVTGGNGFIGSHIVDSLLAENIEVSVLDPRAEQYREALHNVNYVRGSFGDMSSIEESLGGKPEAVIHLAHYGLSVGAPGLPENDVRNLTGSVRFFEMCIEHGVKKIIFMSSGGKIYGETNGLPVSEVHATNPLDSYGITKLAIEKYLMSMARLHSIEAAVVRPSNPYGIRQSPKGAQGVIPIFAWKIINQEPLTVWGDAIRDYIDVRDVGHFCTKAILKSCSGAYNLGSGRGVKTSQLIDMLAGIIRLSPVMERKPARDFDLPAIVLDSTRARNEFSWHPRTDMQEGLVEIVQWLDDLKRSSGVNK
jgi:UDP-glucose 4-epimerase